MAALPVFNSVTYLSPWLPLPPGASRLGVDAIVNAGAPDKTVLAGRLRQGANTLVVGVDISPTEVTLLPPYPLSSMLDYAIDVQWVPTGTQPNQVDWSNPALYVTAPVLTAFARGIYGQVLPGSPGQVQLQWDFGAAAVMPAGATVTGFNSKTKSIGLLQAAGTSGTLQLVGLPDQGSRLYFQAVMPISGDPKNGFKAPFTNGPIQSGIALPMAAPVISTTLCDGATAQVGWTAPATPTPAPFDVRYEVSLVDANGNALGWFPAGATGAVLQLPTPAASALQVAGRTRYGPVASLQGSAAPVVQQIAPIAAATLSADSLTLTITFAPPTHMPTGMTFQAQVSGPTGTFQMPATGSPLQVQMPMKPIPGGGFSLTSYAQQSSGSVTATGPLGPSYAVPVLPVTNLTGSVDEGQPSVRWTPSSEAGVTRYQVVATPDGGQAQTFIAEGNEFAIPLALAAGVTMQVSVAPMGDLVVGPPVAFALTAQQPVKTQIYATAFENAVARIEWAPAASGPVNGYGVLLTGVDANGGQTQFTVPVGARTAMETNLPQEGRAHAWSVQVQTLSGSASALSDAVWLPTVAPVLGPCTVAVSGAQLAVGIGWNLDCTPQQFQAMLDAKAMLEFAVLDGDNCVIVTQQPFSTTNGTAYLTIPVLGSAQQYVSARLVGPDSGAQPAGLLTTGPRAAPVPLLTATPAISSASYDGTNLSIAWSGGLAGATGWLVKLNRTDTAGSLNFTTGPEPLFEAPVAIAAGTWVATVTPLAASSTGLASAEFALVTPHLAVPAIETLQWDGTTLDLSWTPASAFADYQVLLASQSGQPLPNGLVIGKATSARFPLALPNGTDLQATVVARQNNWTDPAAQASAQLLLAGATVATIKVDPASGQATASWAAIANASGYLVRLTEDGAEQGVVTEVSGTSYAFTPPPGASLAVSVAPVSATAGSRIVGPYGAPAAVPALAPKVGSTGFDGTDVSLSWAPVAGASGYRASVFQAGQPQPLAQSPIFAAGITAGSFAVTFAPPDATYVLVLQALFGSFEGPASAATPLLINAGTLAPASFDGRTIKAGFTAPAGPAPVGIAATVLRDGAPVQTGQLLAATEIEVALEAPADPAAAYSLVVNPLLGVAAGPSTTTGFTVATPPIVSTVWGASSIAATVTLASGWTGQGRLVVDGVPGTPQAFDGQGSASFAVPGSGAVALQVQGTVNGAAGPWSDPLPLSRATTASLTLELDGKALTATWQAVPGADHYAVSFTPQGQTAQSVTVAGTSATIQVADPVAGGTVEVAAIIGVSTGPACPPATMIGATVPVTSLSWQDGVLGVGWDGATGATGYRVQVLTGATVTVEADFASPGGSLAVPPGNYGVAVRAMDAVAIGPAAAGVAPLTVAPEIVSTVFAANGDVTVTWAVAGGATDYDVELVAPDQSVTHYSASGSGPLVGTTIPASAVAGKAATIAVRATQANATITGPWSASTTLPVAVPGGILLQLDGNQLTAAWDAVDGASGYVAVLGTDQGDVTATVFQPQAVLTLPDNATHATVTVAAQFGLASGPVSPPATALFGTPTLDQVAWQGGVLTLGWTNPAGATGCLVSVLEGSTPSVEAEFTGTSGAIALPPGDYTVVLRATTAVATGTPTTATALITAQPVLASAAFDAKTGDCTVTWPATGAAVYGIRLTQPGQQPFEDSFTASADPVVYTIPAAKLVGGPFAFTAQGRSAAGGPAVSGPWSDALALPQAVPANIELVLDDGVVTATWDAVDGAAGYVVILTADQGQPVVQSVYEPEAALALPDGATSAGVTVQAVIGSVTGRAAQPVNVLFGTPVLGQAALDGGLLSLSWSNVAGAVASRVTVVNGSSAVAEAELAGTSGAIAVPPGQYGVELRALTANATGPASTLVPLLAGAPEVTSATFVVGGDCQVIWPDIGAPLYGIRLEVPGQQPFTATVAPSGGTVLYTIPAAQLTGGPYSFRCQALSGTTSPVVSGPWSAPLALPTMAVQGLELWLANQLLSILWEPVDAATGYSVNFVTAEGTLQETVYQPQASFAAPDGTTVLGVRVAALFGVVTAPSSASANALFAKPVFTSAGYDGATLTLGWDPVAGLSGYRVELLAGDSVQREAEVTGNQAAIAIAPGTQGVTLRGIAGNSYGAPSSPVVPITAAPAVTSASFDPISGNCTLTWPGVPGATGYATLLTQPGQPPVTDSFTQSGATISYTIPAARLAGGGPFSFAAQGQAAGPPALTGPWSMAVALPSLAPALLDAGYDGAALRADWTPAGDAPGYRVSLVSGGTATVLGDVSGTSASFAAGTAPAGDAALTVQALAPLGAGPAAATLPVYRRGWFVTAQSPWGAAPLVAPAATPADLVVSLPDLFGGNQPAGPLPSNATFKLEASGAGYALTILGSGPAWLWDATSRGQVRTDYDDLTAKLETAQWTPQARALTLEAIARSLPQTFDELLYYGFGFEPAQGWFDLRPGMVLHVEYEAYQYLGPASTLPDPSQAAFLDGFVAAAAADYPVSGTGSGAGWFVTLDSALARMAASEGIQVPTMAPSGNFYPGGGGLIDAFFDQFRQSLCKLVYPPNILGQTSVGDARRADNPVLIAASTLVDLQNAASAVRNDVPLPSNVGAFYFRGRATLSPRIRVTLDGGSLLVPLGTSVGDVLAGNGARGAAPGSGLRLRRMTGPAAMLPDKPGWLDVRLDWTPGNAAWLDLPLMPGDRIETGR